MRWLAAFVCGLALPLGALAGEDSKWTYVDIQPQGNHKLAEDQGNFEGNNLAKVPKGEQEMADSRFKIGEQLIHLKGESEPELPQKVEGIKVDAKGDKLHILHATGHGEGGGTQDDGTEIGSYVVHYSDKTEERIPIVYGEDVRDWWDWPDRPDVTRGKVAWTGSNAASEQNQRKIRLFSMVWKNPHPDKTIASIDYESENTKCDPFLVAVSLEKK
jgi:hypothetical protein